MKKLIYLIFFIAIAKVGFSQKKSIALEDIWEKRTFAAKGIAGFTFNEDGKTYTQLQKNKIIQYDIATGKELRILLDTDEIDNGLLSNKISSYQFGPGENSILLETLPEQIYRYSSTGVYYVYDISRKKLTEVFKAKRIMYPQFSPDGGKIAFVHQNNIYYQDLKKNKTFQISKNGQHNKIINGASDWVYEEEFTLTRAFIWSPNSDQLVYLSFDEARVPIFYMEYFRDSIYPLPYTFKYPKVDQPNAAVSLNHYSLSKNKSKLLKISSCELNDAYLPRIQWTKDNNIFSFTWINRLQNHLRLVAYNTSNSSENILVDEKNKYYIDIHDNLVFLQNGKQFIWSSERSGFNHIYLMDMQGKVLSQLTKGVKELTEFYGLDVSERFFFFQMSEEQGLERKIYRQQIGLNSLSCLTPESGTHSAIVSPGCKFLVITSSTIHSPPVYQIISEAGSGVRVLETNSVLSKTITEFELSKWETFKIANRHGDSLHAIWLKPATFDPSKKYPVFMHLYGGPGSQKVANRWNATGDQFWFQMLAQQGYIICVVDNRGTGGRGEEWKKMTYLQLGKLETEDQIDAAKWLGNLSFVEAGRIGIFGWSYGGYMSSLCLLKGNEVFKSAIAVAPVTHWKWYDSIYTERFMRGYAENKSGYDDNSPILYADRLKGNYLLIHGMGDDNVHFQHTAEMANVLIKNKKQFETYFYPNRHHGISGDNARYHLYDKMTKFVLEKI